MPRRCVPSARTSAAVRLVLSADPHSLTVWPHREHRVGRRLPRVDLRERRRVPQRRCVHPARIVRRALTVLTFPRACRRLGGRVPLGCVRLAFARAPHPPSRARRPAPHRPGEDSVGRHDRLRPVRRRERRGVPGDVRGCSGGAGVGDGHLPARFGQRLHPVLAAARRQSCCSRLVVWRES